MGDARGTLEQFVLVIAVFVVVEQELRDLLGVGPSGEWLMGMLLLFLLLLRNRRCPRGLSRRN